MIAFLYLAAFAIGFCTPLAFDPGVVDSLNAGFGALGMFVVFCMRAPK